MRIRRAGPLPSDPLRGDAQRAEIWRPAATKKYLLLLVGSYHKVPSCSSSAGSLAAGSYQKVPFALCRPAADKRYLLLLDGGQLPKGTVCSLSAGSYQKAKRYLLLLGGRQLPISTFCSL